MESILLEPMFELPGLDGVEEVVINREVVEGRAKPLYIYSEQRRGEVRPAPELPASPLSAASRAGLPHAPAFPTGSSRALAAP